MRVKSIISVGLGLTLIAATGCKGGSQTPDGEESGTSDSDSDSESGETGEPDEPESCAGPLLTGPAPIRRLTRVEYNNTVYQLLGDTSQPANAFPPDEEAAGFDNQAAALVVSPLLAENYMSAAEALAATHAPTLMQAYMPGCLQGEDPNVCAGEAVGFISVFGARAYRRPLTDEEEAVYQFLFTEGTTLGESNYAPQVGVEMALSAMLQSPHFLYRVEFGMADPDLEDDVVALTSYEIASRLSFLLWNTMPDATLFDAAAADELRTPEQIEAQARRLIATPRAREAVKNFHRQWLDLDDIQPYISANGKSVDIYPEFYNEILPLMRKESEAFFDYAIFEENASVDTLFTASYSMMNQELADYYGVAGPGGDTFERVDLDPNRYAGFLTHAGLLALHSKPDRSSPIHRGKFVRETLLCQSPPPPPDVVPEAPNVDTNQTTRNQFIEHSEDALCAGCHQLMDPLGFGFEHFDGIGLYRETEWGLEIDASGEFISTLDIDGPYDGVVEMADRLASSDQVKRCVVQQWFRFGYGRVETDDDECSMDTIEAAFAAADYDIKELIIALTKTDAFRYRPAVTP